MKKIAVIGANKPLLAFYRRAKQLGYYIIGIAYEEGAVCKQYCDNFYSVSFADKEKVLEICREEKVGGITSFSLESALPTLVYVAQSLGLVSNGFDCIERTENKYAMRAAFESNGIPVPQYRQIDNESEIETLNIKYPIIVKPVDGGGSKGINKVETIKGLYKAYEEAKENSRSQKVIIEEYIDGREFSVEYISHKGKHYLLQITDKQTSGAPHFIEMSHHQPADISVEIANRIKEMVEKALDALKIENSASHTEIKLNSRNELYVIEIGARMGGGHITSDLVRLSTGYDMIKGVLELATGDFSEPIIHSLKHSGVYFYSSLAPQVKEVINNHGKYPQIVEWQLDGTEPIEAKSNADRNGYFLYQGDSKLNI